MKILKYLLICILPILMVACGEEEEAKKLGFSNAREMRTIHTMGWHTKKQYDVDIVDVALAKQIEQEKINAAEAEKIREKEEIEKNNATRANQPWFSINIGKMDAAENEGRHAFMLWYIEKPDHYTVDCNKEENPSSMITFLSDKEHYGAQEHETHEIIEIEKYNGKPIDFILHHKHYVINEVSSTIDMRYIKGKKECLKERNYLANIIKIRIDEKYKNTQLEGDRYK